MRKRIIDTLTLSTSRGRLTFIVISSLIVWFVPFHWLSDLSLWQRLGWDWAPSIGLTRSYWLFIHGQFQNAMEFNPIIVPVLIVALIIIIRDVFALWTKHRTIGYTEIKSSKEG